MRSDNDLQSSFSRYAEGLPLAAAIVTIGSGVIVAANRKAKTLIGDEIVGQPLVDHSPQPDSIKASLAIFAKSRSPVPGSWTLSISGNAVGLRVSGARVSIDASHENDALLVTLNKKTAANEGLFGELTVQLDSIRRERHRLLQDNKLLEARVDERTAQLQSQNEELDELNTSLQHFVSMVSHDIAGPVRRIQSFAQLLTEDLEGAELHDNSREFLRYLEESAALLRLMLDGIVRLSRISADEDTWQTTDLDALLKNVVADVKGLNPNVEISIEADSLGEVFGDPGQVQQLLLNLINNAIKFRVPEEPAQIELSSELLPGKSRRELIVKDKGMGIHATDMERVLRPFVRGAGVEEQPGTGLGLAMCQRICQLHKGRLWIERSVHYQEGSPSGTEIRLRLPASAPPG